MDELIRKVEVHDTRLVALEEKTDKLDKDIDEAISHFDRRFEKGTRRMDSIEKEIKDLSVLITKGNEDRERKHKQVMDKLDEAKEKRLLQELQKRDEELAIIAKTKEKNQERAWEIVKAVLWVGAAFALAKLGLDLPMPL